MKNKGFTLIEILIVVAIIGVLTSLLMVNFIGARQRSRDGQRKSDLRQIQSALELYRADQGVYPTGIPDCGLPLQGGSPVVTYMQKTPCDPNSTSGAKKPYDFIHSDTTESYCLRSCLENTNDPQKDSDCAAGTLASCSEGVDYVVQNP